MTGPGEDGLDRDSPDEDDGVLSAADSLESDDLDDDVLDTGVDAGDGYRGSTRWGTTAGEERQGESLDQLLAEEEPDAQPDDDLPRRGGGRTGDDLEDEEEAPDPDGYQPRTGRLVAPDEGAHVPGERDEVAADVGVDGGGAGAEEAAVHLTRDPDWS